MGPEDTTLHFPSSRPVAHPGSAREHDAISSFLSGTSLAVTQLRAQIRRIAPYFRTASLTGEPGCGEEDVARALHAASHLRGLRFLKLNAADAEDHFCSAIAPTTGIGLIYLSQAGTLSPVAQQGVLHLLRRASTHSPRVVAWLGRGLKPLISAGSFSAELAATLGSLRIALPALRERAADITLLIHDRMQDRLQLDRRQHHIDGLRHRPLYLSDEFLNAAVRFSWPGHLHQLYAAVDWLLQNKPGGTLHAGDLVAALEHTTAAYAAKPVARLVRLEQVVQEHVRSVLMACEGNKLRTAEVLGISRSTLYRMLDSGESTHSLLLAG
jgi:DNA-binding NtrC family response regulator